MKAVCSQCFCFMFSDSDSSTAVSDAANELQTTHSLQLDNAELVKAVRL